MRYCHFSTYMTHVKNRSARTIFFIQSIVEDRPHLDATHVIQYYRPDLSARASIPLFTAGTKARPSVWFLCAFYLKHVLLLELQGWPVLCKSWLLRIQLRFQRARFSIGTWWYCRSQGERKERIRGRKVTVLQVCRTSRFDM